MTLVYSQVGGDSWSLRQINLFTSCRDIESEENDFYLKGRYYWRADELYYQYLIWFDMNDEVFGTIGLPDGIRSVSIMNETIALLKYSSWGDSRCFQIWLMIENDNNTYWHKQASIVCVENPDNESWRPIGIWNVDGELLVSLHNKVEWDPLNPDPDHADRGIPNFISLDLVTRERKIFSVSKEKKSITIASNPTAREFQVYNVRNADIPEGWKCYVLKPEGIYARVYDDMPTDHSVFNNFNFSLLRYAIIVLNLR
nr:putative F-box protein At1g19160 [Ipomoea batatas]